MNDNETQSGTPPIKRLEMRQDDHAAQLRDLAERTNHRLIELTERIDETQKYLEDMRQDMFRALDAINAALDRLDAPPSREEAPALQELADRVTALESVVFRTSPRA